ncbi:MAG: invasion associated locus B family protein [Pseudomonadota bacterium]
MRSNTRYIGVGSAVAAALSLALMAGPAISKSSKVKEPDAGANAGQAAVPPGAGWAVQCNNPGQGLVCRATQNIFITKTRQRLLSVAVSKPSGDKNLAMLIQLPHGLFLPGGLSLKVDDDAAKQLAVQTCDQSGCYAGHPIDTALLSKLKSGSRLTISFQNLQKKTMSIPVPLSGFGDAVQKI